MLWMQFFTVALIHLLAVMSPGPDFAMITRNSLVHSRRAAVWSAFGLACGITVHLTYTLIGIGYLISTSILLFSAIKLLGAGYLIYIGIKSLGAKPKIADATPERHADLTAPQAIRMGFLTNVLNPKATIFFVSVFSQVISPTTPLWMKLLMGTDFAVVTFLWFALVSTVFSAEMIRERIRSAQHWIERVTGAVLILFGLKLAFSRAK